MLINGPPINGAVLNGRGVDLVTVQAELQQVKVVVVLPTAPSVTFVVEGRLFESDESTYHRE
jgi:hypothetical protein